MNIILFYDFHVNENPKLVEEAQRLGYDGLALFEQVEGQRKPHKPDYNGELDDGHTTNHDIKIYKGILIQARNPEDMRQKVKKFRKNVDVIMVKGGDQKINRAACEDPRVDIISKTYFNRRDCGINHVIAKKAALNEVSIELNIRHLTKTNPYLHYKVLAQFREILKLKRKFNFPLIITSSAKSIYDLHTPKDLIALSKCFGMKTEEAESALSETPLKIIERSNIRNKVIVDGVKVIK